MSTAALILSTSWTLATPKLYLLNSFFTPSSLLCNSFSSCLSVGLKLSGGEQQRIAIARSLSYNPELILADEPTGNLDHDTENEIINIFKDLAHKHNKCVIIVTHSQNVCNLVDKVYELKKQK